MMKMGKGEFFFRLQSNISYRGLKEQITKGATVRLSHLSERWIRRCALGLPLLISTTNQTSEDLSEGAATQSDVVGDNYRSLPILDATSPNGSSRSSEEDSVSDVTSDDGQLSFLNKYETHTQLLAVQLWTGAWNDWIKSMMALAMKLDSNELAFLVEILSKLSPPKVAWALKEVLKRSNRNLVGAVATITVALIIESVRDGIPACYIELFKACNISIANEEVKMLNENVSRVHALFIIVEELIRNKKLEESVDLLSKEVSILRRTRCSHRSTVLRTVLGEVTRAGQDSLLIALLKQ